MTKVLITGSNGQLGQDCLSIFQDIPALNGVDLPEVDLSVREPCFQVLDGRAPEVVVNCAAFTNVDACETDPSCWQANADLPRLLAEWTEAHGAFLLHVSTDYVFPGDKPLYATLSEEDAPNPISEYGRSKLGGELAVQEMTARHALVRTAWLYGAKGNNFLKTMLRLTLQNPGKEFKVVADQYGSPTWSRSLARQIRAIAERPLQGVFHASSEGYCSWYDLACAFLDELNLAHCFVPCTSAEFPTPTRRPSNSILENARLKSEGLNLFDDWRTELQSFVKMHGEEVLEEVAQL